MVKRLQFNLFPKNNKVRFGTIRDFLIEYPKFNRIQVEYY